MHSLISSSLNITHLSFHNDPSIGKKDGLRHLAPILSNPQFYLQSLSLKDVEIGAEGAAILADSLSTNTSLLSLDISWNRKIGKEDGIRHLAPILSNPQFYLQSLSLKDVEMGAEGAALLADSLSTNTSLLFLDISGNRIIGDEGMEHIARMLLSNSSLQTLNLMATALSSTSAKCLGIALAQNKTLITLDISFNDELGENEMDSMFPPTISLKHLRYNGAPRIFHAFANILRHNTTLTTLDLSENEERDPSRVEVLFKAVAGNICLQSLDLSRCFAVEGDKVVSCILDALQLSSSLTDLKLDMSRLEDKGQMAVIEAHLKRMKETNAMGFPQLLKAKPNCIRLFLCGLPYAGKTTLKRSMVIASKGKFHTTLHALSRNRLQSVNERTRGIDIGQIVYSGISISLWDLAGQEDYYSFHDFMFPDISHVGCPSLFLILCKPINEDGSVKKLECIENEIKYWLRFISSKARPSELFKPTAIIVFTHKDEHSNDFNISPMARLVDAIRADFQPRLNLSDRVFHVNARSSGSSVKILRYVHRTASNILREWPGTYSSCNEVNRLLNEWKVKHPFMHMSTFIRLCNNIEELKVSSPSSTAASTLSEKHLLVAHTLNNSGDILYFPDLNYMIVDLTWFCESLIGQMIKCKGMLNQPNLDLQEEFIKWHNFAEIVNNSLSTYKRGSEGNPEEQAKVILQIMQNLNLGYARSTTEGEWKPEIFIPANLIPTTDLRSWEIDIHSPNQSILGRRLQCLDQEHTMLTPNFFPQIQIALYNTLEKANNIECKLKKNFIKIIDGGHHGMEIHLEFHGYGDDVLNSSSEHNTAYECPPVYIDLLLKSAQTSDRSLKRLQTLVINNIREFCAKWRGCQGVTLIEGILRPDCVEHPEKYSRNQCVLISTLQDKLIKIPTSELHLDTYTWDNFDSLKKRIDHTKELLGEEAFMNIIKKRMKDVQAVAAELQTQSLVSSGETLKGTLNRGLEKNESIMVLDALTDNETLQEAGRKQLCIEDSGVSFGEFQECMNAGLGRVEEKVDRVLQKMEELTNNMIRMEEEVLRNLRKEIHAVLDITNWQGSPLEHKTPHLFYFTQRNYGIRERVAKLVASVDCYQLRFCCEGLPQSTGSMHQVDHDGLRLYCANSEKLRKAMPYLNRVLKLMTLVVKVGAHVVAGAGELVPDLAKLPALVFDSAVIDLSSMKLAALLNPEVVEADHPSKEQKQSAEQWLVDILIENTCYSGKAIAETFGLYRVKHRESFKVSWVCDEHKKHPEFIPFAVCP